jgi:nicotinate-nucleotide adenylyltransferase
VHVLRTALAAGRLARCHVVPAARSPFKQAGPALSDAERCALVQAACEGLERVVVDQRELRRGPPSYTMDTVRELKAELAPDAQVVLVLGSDNLPDLPRWRQGRELLELVEPLIVHRGGEAEEALARACAALPAHLQQKLRAGYVHQPEVVASSTDLRARLAARDETALRELPAAVAQLITTRGLYGWHVR